MRRLIFSILAFFIITLPAMAQVDTVWLQQLNVINTSENGITYVQDLRGDGANEIIFSGRHYLKVYDGMTGNTIWTSPYLTYNYDNEKAQFFDVNNDGDLDIALIDSSNLEIFDPVHDSLIWISPDIPQWRRANFGFGDVNLDGHIDVILSRPEPYRYDNDPDTTWVEYYDGPDFHFAGRSFLLLTARGLDWADGATVESPSKIFTGMVSGPQGPESKLIIFTSVKYEAHFVYGGPEDLHHYNDYQGNGNIRFLNVDNFSDMVEIDSVGSLLYISIRQADTSITSIDMVSEKYIRWDYDYPPGREDNTNYYKCRFSGPALEDSIKIASTTTGWKGLVVGDLNSNNVGDEIFYTDYNSVYMKSYPELQPIWAGFGYPPGDRAVGPYHSPSLFPNPKIIVYASQDYDHNSELYDCATGAFTDIIFPYIYFWRTFVADLDNNGEDEIIGFYGTHQIFIYHLSEFPDGVNEHDINLPASFRLYANYPNPFNTSTIIKYDLPKEADVSLEVYDILGRKIGTLANENQNAGTHQVTWDGSGVSSGIYFYRLQAGYYSEIKKMTLLK